MDVFDDRSDIVEIEQEEGEQRELRYESLSARDKRALLFHILYVAESYDYQLSVEAIVDNLNRGFNLDIPSDAEIVYHAAAIVHQRLHLDEQYKPFLLHWRFDRIGVCTKLILRYAVWELLNTSVAPIIIINEAIELAKCYAERDAYKFINGVLDEVIKDKKIVIVSDEKEQESKEDSEL